MLQGWSLYNEDMPSKNRVKDYAPEQIYHIYNRGNNKESIFLDDEDYAVFLNMLKRHLSQKEQIDKTGRGYRNFYKEIELLAFCLMPNHFHLLIYQSEKDSMTKLMRSVATAYSAYFNRKYKRVGRLFQDVFKASIIDEDAYWLHISRYIHLNPRKWRTWEWSSLAYYLEKKHTDWIRPERAIGEFTPTSYLEFVEDYEDYKDMLDELKHITAD